MKKIMYLLAFIGITTISCDPLEETYNELDGPFSDDVRGDVEFTMTDDDYEDIANDDVANNKSFESFDQAKELLPALLVDKYAGLGFTSTAKINFGFNRSITKAVVPSDERYTVSSEDYMAQGGNVERFGNFSSFDQIVAFLNTRYPEALNEFLVTLTYQFFDGGETSTRTGFFKNNAGTWEEVFFELNEKTEVTEADYTAQGGNVARFGNFSSPEHIDIFLNSKFTNAIKNTVVNLTYLYFDGGVNELTNLFLYNGVDSWTMAEGELLSEQAYTDMGERFPNFSDQEEAENKLPIYLKNTFDQFAVAGDTYEYIYEVFNRSLTGSNRTEYTYVYLIFDGQNWNLTRNAIPDSLSFAHDGSVWVPDNTIRYTFTSEDYDFVVDKFTGVAGFEDEVSNLDRFGNFDRRNRDTAWDSDQMLQAVNELLLNNNPDAEEGQKFIVNYNIFDGSNGTEDLSVILSEGAYILNTGN